MITEEASPFALDRTDARILRVLQSDGRISNLKLAEAVHLSPTAVLERVKRLTRDGFILGYEARLNPDKLGAGLMVFIEGASAAALIQQQVWLLAGTMELTLGGRTWRLDAGDCLAMRVDGPVEFRNPTRRPARYLVAVASEAPRRPNAGQPSR